MLKKRRPKLVGVKMSCLWTAYLPSSCDQFKRSVFKGILFKAAVGWFLKGYRKYIRRGYTKLHLGMKNVKDGAKTF